MTHAFDSARRIGLIVANTLREALRQRVLIVLLLAGVVFVGGARYLRELNFGTPELKFIVDLGFGGIGLFGAVLAITLTAQLFFAEIEGRTVSTLLARPVHRAEFVLGKFVGSAAVVGSYSLLLTVLLAAVVWSRERSLLHDLGAAPSPRPIVEFGWIAAMGWFVALKLLVMAGLTLLIASYARTQLFTTTIGFLVFVACHLLPFARGAAAHTDSRPMRWLAQLMVALPDFQYFTVAASGNAAVWNQVLRVSVYGSSYVAITCGLAAFCFRRREI
ncbi:MAG: hypothetical protein JWM32_1687 [Verrucomicrobia bacterium]|nr:hypothetical protein [Verrucomicrobiota bacterium]